MDFKNDQEMILSLALPFMNIYTLFYRFGVHISIFLSFLSKDENSLILIVFISRKIDQVYKSLGL